MHHFTCDMVNQSDAQQRFIFLRQEPPPPGSKVSGQGAELGELVLWLLMLFEAALIW